MANNNNQARVHIFISGVVQGVFFRVRTVQKAKELGLAGWVKNTDDGRVEAVFEGGKQAIEKMINWMRIGPPQARNIQLGAEWEDCKGEFNDFNIIK